MSCGNYVNSWPSHSRRHRWLFLMQHIRPLSLPFRLHHDPIKANSHSVTLSSNPHLDQVSTISAHRALHLPTVLHQPTRWSGFVSTCTNCSSACSVRKYLPRTQLYSVTGNVARYPDPGLVCRPVLAELAVAANRPLLPHGGRRRHPGMRGLRHRVNYVDPCNPARFLCLWGASLARSPARGRHRA